MTYCGTHAYMSPERLGDSKGYKIQSDLWSLGMCSRLFQIGHVNEYPTMHYFGIPRHTQSMITYDNSYDFVDVFLEILVENSLWECC